MLFIIKPKKLTAIKMNRIVAIALKGMVRNQDSLQRKDRRDAGTVEPAENTQSFVIENRHRHHSYQESFTKRGRILIQTDKLPMS